MNLSEHLLYRDINELGQMATFYECDCNRNSKLDLVQSIHYQLLNREVCQQKIEKIDKNLIYFITYIFLQKKTSFHVDELTAKGNYICKVLQLEVMTRKWIAQLLKMGWLYPVSNQFQIEIQLPIDLKQIVEDTLLAYWRSKISKVNLDTSRIKYRDEHYVIIQDLLIFLEYVQKEEILLTTEGYIYKRNQQQLMQLLHIKEELLHDHTWRFGYGRRFPGYPNRFALLYDFAYFKQWIREENNTLSITPDGQEAIQKLNQQDRHVSKDLIEYWLKSYKQPIPLISFIIPFMYYIANEEWVELNDMRKIIEGWLLPYYYDNITSIFQERILQMLVHLGLAQVAIDEQKEENIYLKLNRLPI